MIIIIEKAVSLIEGACVIYYYYYDTCCIRE